jgi:hypothetical protein
MELTTAIPTSRKKRLPANFRSIGKQNYVIVDPMSFKKTKKQCDTLTAIIHREGHKVAKYRFKDGWVMYKSVARLYTKQPKVAAPAKKKVGMKVAPAKKVKIVTRTEAYFSILTDRQKERYLRKNMVQIPPAHF